MKKIITILMLLPVLAMAQTEYKEIVLVDSSGATALYAKAKYFVAKAFNNSKEVLQLDDPSTTHLLAKGSVQSQPGLVDFTLDIECRDNKYRYTISGLMHHFISPAGYDLSGGNIDNATPIGPLDPAIWQKVKENTSVAINNFISSLKMSLAKGDDNW